jgi:UTP--glucose-1-phosphate uridylyltransferase
MTDTDNSLFDTLVRRWKAGELSPETNRLRDVTPLAPGDVGRLPPRDSPEARALEAAGGEAMEAGQVGAVILSGGMATRFNYEKPKGLYPILDGKSFLELKVEWLTRAVPRLPIFIMTSFHTDAMVRAHLEEKDYFGASPQQVHCFLQDKLPRLTPQGERFSPADPSETYAAPGHGDFPMALRRSGLLARFLKEGGRYLSFSNVDNLGASLEPAIIGWHIRSAKEMTVEVAAKAKGDKGGAPARVEGRVQLVEGFAFPKDFDQDSIPVFNTASYVFTAAALEHLAGDLSRTLSVSLLEVEREERFIPVKSQDEVPQAQVLIRRKLERMRR